MRSCRPLAAALLLAAGLVAVLAGGARAAADYTAIPEVLRKRIQPGMLLEHYVNAIMQQFRSVARGKTGIDQASIDAAVAAMAGQARQQALMRFLPMDLNGDGKVTRDEVVSFLSGQMYSNFNNGDINLVLDRQVSEIMKADANGDGVIDLEEMRAAARPPAIPDEWKQLLALSPRKDGTLTAMELIKAAEGAFAMVDTNSDGTISRDEFDAMQKVVWPTLSPALVAVPGMPPQPVQPARAACVLPPADAKSKVVLYGTYEGSSYSSTAVAGLDHETRAARVIVEDGTEPLYLILSSFRPMIWQVEGAVGRIDRLVLAPMSLPNGIQQPPAGATGVAKDRVTFLTPNSCFDLFFKPESIEGTVAKSAVGRALGRAPDAVGGNYGTYVLRLPSFAAQAPDATRLASAASGRSDINWTLVGRAAPGGLAEIDPKSVVAPGTPERYDVLPSRLGIGQLVARGALQPLDNEQYKIVKPFARFPADLAGGPVKFLLGAGVPMPAGDASRLCVVSEATGKPVPGSAAFLCR